MLLDEDSCAGTTLLPLLPLNRSRVLQKRLVAACQSAVLKQINISWASVLVV